jgi:glycosyltransferase involved in cell wall biosynthesis
VRIAYINMVSYIGGAEVSLLELIRGLRGQPYEPYVISSESGVFTEAVASLGVPTILTTMPGFRKRYPWRYAVGVGKLAWELMRRRIDLVHTNCDRALRQAMHACQLSRIPYVCHVRHTGGRYLSAGSVVALNKSSGVIANSAFTGQQCIDAGVDQSRLHVIYNPIDLDLYRKTKALGTSLIKELGLSDDVLLIGQIGQIQEEKGHRELVQAASSIVKALPNAHFVIVGAATTPKTEVFLRELQELIANQQLSERFSFVGFRTDVPLILHSLDIMVVPSLVEPFGRVVAEALAANLPVVATNVGGIPEIITDGWDGLLVPARDTDALGDAVIRLGSNPELRGYLSANGLDSVKRFSTESHVSNMAALYERVVQKNQQPL